MYVILITIVVFASSLVRASDSEPPVPESQPEYNRITVNHTLSLFYRNVAERDNLLQHIVERWETVLSRFGASDFTLSILGAPGPVDRDGFRLVNYQIHFTEGEADRDLALVRFRTSLSVVPIDGVQKTVGTLRK